MTPAEAQARLLALDTFIGSFDFDRNRDHPIFLLKEWEYKMMLLWALADIAGSLRSIEAASPQAQ